jgi:superfamily II DNA helicase RecQ
MRLQRTGWGKSLVYFLATKLLRDQGLGPTLLISPLLSLMRNQFGLLPDCTGHPTGNGMAEEKWF